MDPLAPSIRFKVSCNGSIALQSSDYKTAHSTCLNSLANLDALGVMRFLQLEWHNHERARNAWDIERAEMKAKIAKQEGEVRSAKRLNNILNKQIRMLEQALKNERAKNKAASAGENPPAADEKDSKGKADVRPDSK